MTEHLYGKVILAKLGLQILDSSYLVDHPKELNHSVAKFVIVTLFMLENVLNARNNMKNVQLSVSMLINGSKSPDSF